MPILVKSDDVRSGRKAKGRHGPLWRLGSQWVKENCIGQWQILLLSRLVGDHNRFKEFKDRKKKKRCVASICFVWRMSLELTRCCEEM